MKKNNIASAFNLNYKDLPYNELNDYEVFKDKKLLEELRTQIIENIIDASVNTNNLSDFLNEKINQILDNYDLSNLERSYIFNLIDNEVNGFGPLTELLKDNNITEIMVNSPKEVYIEINGNIIKDQSVSFINDDHIIRTIQRLIQPLGRTIDQANPMVDSRLLDGSRINAIIPPLSVRGPVITIRKFKKMITSIDDLLRVGTMTPYMARFLEAAVKSKLNILICGGTGSGKTTLLNILSSFIDEQERIITIEDAAELNLKQPHVVSLETRIVNYDSNNEVTIRDLLINSLRMRPDRIIIGEVRGKEAFDLLQAMNTGHDGSISTLHASGTIDALNRLETMVLMAGIEIPVLAIREYILNAIDLVINIERLSDGKRKIVTISELDGMDKDQIKLNHIFEFKQIGLTPNKEVSGEYRRNNFTPKVLDKIKRKGINDIDYIFED